MNLQSTAKYKVLRRILKPAHTLYWDAIRAYRQKEVDYIYELRTSLCYCNIISPGDGTLGQVDAGYCLDAPHIPVVEWPKPVTMANVREELSAGMLATAQAEVFINMLMAQRIADDIDNAVLEEFRRDARGAGETTGI